MLIEYQQRLKTHLFRRELKINFQARGELDEAIAPHVWCYAYRMDVRVVFPLEQVPLVERDESRSAFDDHESAQNSVVFQNRASSRQPGVQ